MTLELASPGFLFESVSIPPSIWVGFLGVFLLWTYAALSSWMLDLGRAIERRERLESNGGDHVDE